VREVRKVGKQRKSEMINEVDNTIISVCKNIENENFIPELYPKTVAALAALVLARAVLH